jgi:hypothetical protein
MKLEYRVVRSFLEKLDLEIDSEKGHILASYAQNSGFGRISDDGSHASQRICSNRSDQQLCWHIRS